MENEIPAIAIELRKRRDVKRMLRAAITELMTVPFSINTNPKYSQILKLTAAYSYTHEYKVLSELVSAKPEEKHD